MQTQFIQTTPQNYIRVLPSMVADAIAVDAQSIGTAPQNFAGYSNCGIVQGACLGPTLRVYTGRNLNLAAPASANDLAVYLDGAYLQAITPTLNQVSVSSVAIPNDGKLHSFSIVTAQTSKPAAIVTGGYVVALQGSQILLTNPVVNRKMIVYGDSLHPSCGTLQGKNDWLSLMRAVYPGRISCEGYGFRGYFSDQNDPWVIDRFKRLAYFANTVEVVFFQGTNDYGLSLQAPAAMQTQVTARLTATRVAFGSRLKMIWLVTPLTRGTETTLGLGDLPSYRTALVAAAASANATAGFTIVTVIDGTAMGLNTSTDYIETPAANALHVNDLGAAKVFASTRVVIGV